MTTTVTTTRAARAALALGACALVLAGCGGADDPQTGETAGVEVTEPTNLADTGGTDDATGDSTGDSTGDDSAGGTDDATDGSGAGGGVSGSEGLPPRPTPDDCVDVPEAEDGFYTVYDAGTAVVTRDGDTLVIGEYEAAEGWTARVDKEDRDEVEIDFRLDGTQDELDLEIEIDDGRVQVEICADDD